MRTNHLLVIICSALSASCSIYTTKTFSEYDAGVSQAARDLSRGKIIDLDNLGIMRSGTLELRSDLRKRYGIEYKYDGSVSDDYLMGYNRVMRSAAREKFREDYQKKVMPKRVGPLRFLE